MNKFTDFLASLFELLAKLEPWKNLSTPRKMMLIAIAAQMVTMFILTKDSDSFGTLAVSLPSATSSGYTEGHYWFGPPEATGWEQHPLGPFVLIALFVMFATKNYEREFWKKHGYKISIGLMLFLTTGGAALRVFGGGVNVSAFLLACGAAFLHSKQMKANKVLASGEDQSESKANEENISSSDSSHEKNTTGGSRLESRKARLRGALKGSLPSMEQAAIEQAADENYSDFFAQEQEKKQELSQVKVAASVVAAPVSAPVVASVGVPNTSSITALNPASLASSTLATVEAPGPASASAPSLLSKSTTPTQRKTTSKRNQKMSVDIAGAVVKRASAARKQTANSGLQSKPQLPTDTEIANKNRKAALRAKLNANLKPQDLQGS